MPISSYCCATALFAMLSFLTPSGVFAQADGRGGTTASPHSASTPDVAFLPELEPSFIAARVNAVGAPASAFSYATGGGALRNRSTTSIGISGAVAPISAAYLYWAVITEGEPPASTGSITLTRESPAPVSSATVKGTVIGTGASPCWAGDRITVYRGQVSTSLANGNGLYRVTISSAKGTAGSTNGADPWLEAKDPLWEGASLVLVGKGTGSVVIFDKGLAGATWEKSLSYTLNLPVTASGKLTLFDNIAADGQIGVSRDPLVAVKSTEMNGKLVEGTGSLFHDSGWNGTSGWPLPQLWDDTGVDVTSATPKGTKSIKVVVSQTSETKDIDCLTPVANILEIH